MIQLLRYGEVLDQIDKVNVALYYITYNITR